MKWMKYPDIKPKNYMKCLVYGQIYDTRLNLPLEDVFDFAVYFEEEDVFTIGSSSGQPWEPQYWMEFSCEFPELNWPSPEEIIERKKTLKGESSLAGSVLEKTIKGN